MKLATSTPEPELKPEQIDHAALVEKPMPGDFTLSLTNLTGGDIRFLTDLVALFCDPNNKKVLDGLRAGRMGIYRDPITHQCIASDLFTPPMILKRQSQKN